MKQRTVQDPAQVANVSIEGLARAFAALGTEAAAEAFLRDLCTPAELEAMADRWAVIPYLLSGVPYRDIHDRTGVSVTTIGRVARTYETGTGGYAGAVEKLGLSTLRTGRSS
jgi:uncharacterized protein YerC